jgi:hypothetical protein
MCDRAGRNLCVTALCLITLGALFYRESTAAKPGSGGGGISPAPGTIYFVRHNFGPMQMNGDGSGKTTAPYFGWPNSPSSETHTGSRWFLAEDYDWDGLLDPWGNPPLELFADKSGVRVQLTGDPNVRRTYEWGTPTWAKDDSFVSFPAVMNTDSGVVGGLWVVPIDWSTSAPVAGPPILVVETEVYEDPEWWGWSVTYIDYRHDWSPGGDQVAFETWTADISALQLLVATISPTGVSINPLVGRNAAWSPDGSRIAVERVGDGIWTINPDGSGAVRLTQTTTTNKEQRRQGSPTWSPDGAFLAFTESVAKNNGTTSYSVLRIGSGGGAAVNLTSDVGSAYGPRWRN